MTGLEGPQEGALQEPAANRQASPRRDLRIALPLFLLTLISTTTLGAVWQLDDVLAADAVLWLSPQRFLEVWSDPQTLTGGLQFSLPAMFILLCHELGHYFACRYYRVQVSLPFFLPVPLGLGTFGAFIRIRQPIRSRRALFDVGIAGPLAGFLALLPFLWLGIRSSSQLPMREVSEGGIPTLVIGSSLLFQEMVTAVQGEIPTGTGLALHPFALAAWLGLLATSLNLLPIGQLDGGHIVYALSRRWQRRLALPLWIVLVLASAFWPGWLLWGLLLLILGLRHPDLGTHGAHGPDDPPLDLKRKLLAVVALLILVLSFMPAPVGILFLAP